MKLIQLITLSGLLLSPSILAQTQAGKTMVARGNVKAVDESNEAERKLKRRSPIFGNDVVSTGANSKAQLRMTDGGMIALKENSELQISNYQFSEENGRGSVVMELVKGGLRSVTGSIKAESGDYKLKTPVGSIGIRGTHYEVEIVGSTIWIAVWDGAVDLDISTGESAGSTLSLGGGEGYSYASIDEGGKVTTYVEPPETFESGMSSEPDEVEQDDEAEEETAEEESSQTQTNNESNDALSDSEETDDDSEEDNNESSDESGGETEESGDTDDQTDNDQTESDQGSEDSNSEQADQETDQTSPTETDTTTEDSNQSDTTDTGNTTETGDQSTDNTPATTPEPQSNELDGSTGVDTAGDGSGDATGTGNTDSGSDSETELSGSSESSAVFTSSVAVTITVEEDSEVIAAQAEAVDTDVELQSQQQAVTEEELNPAFVPEVINEAQTEFDDVPDAGLSILELIQSRSGEVSYNQLSESSAISTSGTVNNFQLSMNIDFDNGTVPGGKMSMEDDGGEWFATFGGVIDVDNLDLDVTFASHGNNLADGDIDAAFFGELETIIGSFTLHEIVNPGIKVEGSFKIK